MSKFTARIGDEGKGECLVGHEDIEKGQPKPFITTFVTGSNNVFVNYKPVVRIGDVGKTDCGHETEAVTGSTTVYVNYRFVHRIGDVGKVVGDGDTYEVITGSTDVFLGG
jgi:uncharacterized Zn-binding protein involved in type VI secretion